MNTLITGANRGIGLELVRLNLAQGARVFAGCRFPERAAELNKKWARQEMNQQPSNYRARGELQGAA